MKIAIMSMCILGTSFVQAQVAQVENYKIVIEPAWRTLDSDASYAEKLGGHWVLVGNFTFKKKSDETIHLDRLTLRWHGPVITKLTGELYSKRPDREFVPLEEYLVCDGIWSKAKQELLLAFNCPLVLGPVNELCLVLTIPKDLEPIVKQGTFDLALHALPAQFREAASNTTLSLAFNMLAPQLGEGNSTQMQT